jgi:uncharacterized membrane protein YphA (DoxX/SURF4 family)
LAFPGGRSGVALLFLRFAFGLIGIAEGFIYLSQAAKLESLCLGIVLEVAGVLVVVGLLTSYSAMAIAIGTVCRGLISSSISPYVFLQGPFSSELLIVLGIVITLLGPGVFSLDSRLFGRREIVIPRRTRE